MLEKPKFCANCGAPLVQNDQFCGQCGHRIAGALETPVATSASQPARPQQPPTLQPPPPTQPVPAADQGGMGVVGSMLGWGFCWALGWSLYGIVSYIHLLATADIGYFGYIDEYDLLSEWWEFFSVKGGWGLLAGSIAGLSMAVVLKTSSVNSGRILGVMVGWLIVISLVESLCVVLFGRNFWTPNGLYVFVDFVSRAGAGLLFGWIVAASIRRSKPSISGRQVFVASLCWGASALVGNLGIYLSIYWVMGASWPIW